MAKRRHKTDYQIVAEALGVKPDSVRQAVKRRQQYPQSRLLKAYDELQTAKTKALKKQVA